jgi:hypothetical protein
LSSLRSLTELNVGENKLGVLPDLSKLTNMKRLAAFWNNLVVAPDVRKLSALEVCRWRSDACRPALASVACGA